jgi:ribokinase
MTPTVIVVGSINVDLCTFVKRLPRPGETVIGGTFERQQGGKGANQAVAAARLGAQVLMVGMVGDDDLGRAAREDLASEGVDVGEVAVGKKHTGVAEILIDENAENLIAVATGANDELTAGNVTESLGRIDVEDAVVLSVLEISMAAVSAAATAAHERGWQFILNPAPAAALDADLLSRCDVLTPNEHEVKRLGSWTGAEQLLSAGARAVVVTKGAAGADLLRAAMPLHHQPGLEVEAVDTTGAGDAFTGALAWAVAGGDDLETAVRMAAVCGSLSTRSRGARTGMPTAADVAKFL